MKNLENFWGEMGQRGPKQGGLWENSPSRGVWGLTVGPRGCNRPDRGGPGRLFSNLWGPVPDKWREFPCGRDLWGTIRGRIKGLTKFCRLPRGKSRSNPFLAGVVPAKQSCFSTSFSRWGIFSACRAKKAADSSHCGGICGGLGELLPKALSPCRRARSKVQPLDRKNEWVSDKKGAVQKQL